MLFRSVEPWITTKVQSYGWSAGYVLFVAVCIGAGVYSLRAHTAAQAESTAQATDDGPPPTWAQYGLWLLLSAMGSFMLLAVTNHITHDVASVPFLWLLPLTIYLITFILCFEGRSWYKRLYFIGPLIVVVCALGWFLHEEGGIMDFKIAVPLFSAGLFIMCMFFHGELAAMKPAPRYLTTFFLMVSLGGALGGVVVGFIAPKFFNTYYEFGIGLVVTLLLAAWLSLGNLANLQLAPLARLVPMVILVATGFTGFHVYHYIHALSNDARLMSRNFYGTLRVKDTGPDTSETAMRRLMHGAIMHGEQYLHKDKRHRLTTYYTESSGVGFAINHFKQAGPVRLGVVGLGTGTIAIIAGASSGIEPLFSLAHARRMGDGTVLTEVSAAFEQAAHEGGYHSDELLAALARGARLGARDDVPAEAKRRFTTAHDLDWEAHVRMQAAFQAHTDLAVSRSEEHTSELQSHLNLVCRLLLE